MVISVSFAGSGERLSKCRHVGLIKVDLIDRDQWQAYVAYLLQEAMKGGLVGYQAVDDGGAVAGVGDCHSVEPGGPSGMEMALEADFVSSGVVVMVGRFLAHGLLPSAGAFAWMDLCRRRRRLLV
jgi:hypothetical protein